MKSTDVFPSEYLRAADLKGRDVTVTMDSMETKDIGSDHKPVLYFKNAEKGLVMNKTNWNMIAEIYGDESDDWMGKKITLYPTRVDFQGKRVDAIRVKAVGSNGNVAPGRHQPHDDPPPPPVPTHDLDDEIPF